MGGNQEEEDYHDERGAEGDGTETPDSAVGIAGAVGSDDDGLDEGGLLVGWHGDGFGSIYQ